MHLQDIFRLVEQIDKIDRAWMSPSGEIHPVTTSTHVGFMLEHPDLFGSDKAELEKVLYRSDRPHTLIAYALKKGWVRINTDYRHPWGTFWVGVEAGDERSALKAARILAKTGSITDKLWVEIGTKNYYLVEPSLDTFLKTGRLRESVQIDENEIPVTDYGYWITAEGKFIATDSHSNTLNDYNFSNYSDAFRAGWIRVVMEYSSINPAISVMIYVPTLNKKSYRALAELLNKYKDWNVNYEVAGRPRVPDTTYRGAAKALAAIRKSSPELMAQLKESENPLNIPSTKYGYWVKPDGTAISVDLYHGAVLNSRKMSYFRAMKSGWLRIAISKAEAGSSGSISIQLVPQRLTAKSYRTVAAIMRKYNLERAYIETMSGGESWKPRTLQTTLKVLRALNPEIRKSLVESALPPTPYGYWVKPDGNVIVVPGNGIEHIHMLPKNMGSDGNWTDQIEYALKQGWVRVIAKRGTEDQFNIMCYPSALTFPAMRTISGIARQGWDSIYVDVEFPDGKGIAKRGFTPDSLMNSLREWRKQYRGAEQ